MRPTARLALCALALLAFGCKKPRRAAPSPQASPAVTTAFFGHPPDGKLHVYFLDVGQGSAALIVSPTGKTVLVDGGPADAGGHVVNRLPELLRGPPDWVFLTVPLPEHVGGLDYAIRAVGARRLLDPSVPAADASYANLQLVLRDRQIDRYSPRPDPKAPGEPMTIDLGGGASAQVFWPRLPVEALLSSSSQSPELNSLVFRVSYGESAILFMGDALEQTERYLLEKRFPFRSTVLVVGDHGSDRASSPVFLSAVRPKVAVISVGAGNPRSLPAPAVLERFSHANAQVFRTDLDGELHLVSDGEQVAITPERPAAGESPGTPHLFSATGPAEPVAAAPEPETHERHEASGARYERGEDTPRPAPSRPAPYYVASRKSDVFHLPTCRAAKRIHPENRVVFKTRAEALAHKRPAHDCNP